MSRIFSYYLRNGDGWLPDSESGRFLLVTTCMKAARARLEEFGCGATHVVVAQNIPGKRQERVLQYTRNPITGEISMIGAYDE